MARTVLVGNLNARVGVSELLHLFSNISTPLSCQVILDGCGGSWGLVELASHRDACRAFRTLDKIYFYGKKLQVQIIQEPGLANTIYVGNLAPEVGKEELKEAFQQFGIIGECKVLCNRHAEKVSCYGFVTFLGDNSAERAIKAMDGAWVRGSQIRVNWATRRPHEKAQVQVRTYEEIYSQASSHNTTVYCRGLPERSLHHIFSQFGQVLHIKPLLNKGYAFIVYATKESAAFAIYQMQNLVVCNWSRHPTFVKCNIPSDQVADSQFPLVQIPL